MSWVEELFFFFRNVRCTSPATIRGHLISAASRLRKTSSKRNHWDLVCYKTYTTTTRLLMALPLVNGALQCHTLTATGSPPQTLCSRQRLWTTNCAAKRHFPKTTAIHRNHYAYAVHGGKPLEIQCYTLPRRKRFIRIKVNHAACGKAKLLIVVALGVCMFVCACPPNYKLNAAYRGSKSKLFPCRNLSKSTTKLIGRKVGGFLFRYVAIFLPRQVK